MTVHGCGTVRIYTCVPPAMKWMLCPETIEKALKCMKNMRHCPFSVCPLQLHIPALGCLKINLMWSSLVVSSYALRFVVLCIVKCFSVYHGYKEWYLSHHNLSILLKTSGNYVLSRHWPIGQCNKVTLTNCCCSYLH